jgi:hypothetical protein
MTTTRINYMGEGARLRTAPLLLWTPSAAAGCCARGRRAPSNRHSGMRTW